MVKMINLEVEELERLDEPALVEGEYNNEERQSSEKLKILQIKFKEVTRGILLA